MKPADAAQPEYVAAFTELARRIASALMDVPAGSRPIQMFVAGGAAMHLYGNPRTLYFDYQYNDSGC